VPNTLAPRQISRRVALTALRNLSDRWKLKQKYWPQMLHKSESTIYQWLREIEDDIDAEAPLDADVAERISYLLSIYNGLHILYGDSTFADEWMKLANRAFGGVEPIELVKTGVFADLVRVRTYIDRANAR
jgi:hypothetical protein